MNSFRKGVLSAVFAQILWGLFPIYWKWLNHVYPLEILSHRNLWCAFFLALLVLASKERRTVCQFVFRNGRELVVHALSAMLVASNWLVYIWAVNNDRVIDASLGYFLSPLVSVVLGYLFFTERLVRLQWLAVALASTGVLVMTVASGVVPWIGLTLAITFGVYGLARKKANTGPINGLFIETLTLIPITLLALYWMSTQEPLNFNASIGKTEMLLIVSGLVTAAPLVLYAQGARSLPLSLSGIIVFITPTIQFLVGWVFYDEIITRASWIGFVCIWIALVLYSAAIVRMKRPSF